MAIETGNYDFARSLFLQSLAIRHESEDSREIAGPLEGLASLAAVQGDWSRVARLLGAAQVIRGENGRSLESFDAAESERVMATLRDHLSPTDFEQQWAEGSRMSVGQVINYASASSTNELD